MRELFGSYYENAFPGQNFWEYCTFSFDANVLLNLYSLSPQARENFLKILAYIENRVFLTHQAALEYHRRIDDRIREQVDVYDQNNIVSDLAGRRKKLAAIEHHPFCDFKEIAKSLDVLIPTVRALYEKAEQKKQEYRYQTLSLQNRLASLFENKIGRLFTDDELLNALKRAEMRFKLGRPPGFEDRIKTYNSAGDVLIWFQLLEKFQQADVKKLAFVTDDSKPDWWKDNAPHPDLVTEMRQVGIEFYMLNSKSFLRKLPKILSIKVDFKELDLAADELSQIAADAKRQMGEVDPLSMEYVLRQLGSDAELFWESERLSGAQCAAIEEAFTVRLQQTCSCLEMDCGAPGEMIMILVERGTIPREAFDILERAFDLLVSGKSNGLPYKSDPCLAGADRILSALGKTAKATERG